MFLRLLYNIKSVLNVYYFANHNFYLCYKRKALPAEKDISYFQGK